MKKRKSIFFTPPGLVLERDYRNVRFVLSLTGELHCTVNKSVECVVFTHTYILVRIVNCSSLANDDIACLYSLTTELLETKSFAL